MNLYFNNNTISVIPEMPEYLEHGCNGKPICCRGERCRSEIYLEEYNEAIKQAKLSAIPLKDQEEGYLIIRNIHMSSIASLFQLTPDTIYKIEGYGYKVEEQWRRETDGIEWRINEQPEDRPSHNEYRKVAVLIPLSEPKLERADIKKPGMREPTFAEFLNKCLPGNKTVPLSKEEETKAILKTFDSISEEDLKEAADQVNKIYTPIKPEPETVLEQDRILIKETELSFNNTIPNSKEVEQEESQDKLWREAARMIETAPLREIGVSIVQDTFLINRKPGRPKRKPGEPWISRWGKPKETVLEQEELIEKALDYLDNLYLFEFKNELITVAELQERTRKIITDLITRKP